MPTPTLPGSTPIRGISSMATRQLLAELVTAFEQRSGMAAAIESVGGVDAAQRVRAGEAFDVVVLASDALHKLVAAGQVVAGSVVDLVHSGVAVAVKAGAPQPDIASEDAVRQAVLAARTISYSTGPSGVALAALFERWGIADAVRERIVQAPPGVPVGTLVARGEVELGFQQLSELLHVQGIAVLGPLPPEIQITTTFSAGVCANAAQPEAARALIAFMASSEAADAKRRQGMDPA
ncbi:MAG: substrate-binding domain-containing protein [Hydrogenophaga sp.]|uniref:substrate-binding domain-containing protein n=1 Tax=Hydrogenophaga sp. TaxID=1904254 RepID=UPI00271A07B1|nr:substrate-binding domain-containing protein [Hydrogenophaga sp.]MDO9480638.1 substrate-binding domain-containing protein [Hydrogenophaga sp.]MDP2096913.1 substrate-binding domain-containing protein [Hydrogenophaga sp.]MDP2221391.1 substrate-binding domain-containing protein [Hydrogenophaga sp.]MDP3346796.1 substrate-binding domain-containing protein [Hydrogenophaga sp.]MDP3808628.1 substrate-binding domain-containing protein [Hydrogenophaga sp.]